jgi:serine/threonine-protein kinase
MPNKSNALCPQCLHQNSIDSLKCSLCDWQLIQPQLEETRAASVDPDVTIAPATFNRSGVDPDLTQAPLSVNPNATNINHSLAEKQTFHLAGDLAHFEVHEILGQGGMGAVYHARDITLQRDVAIKMLRPLQVGSQLNNDALLEEARMASKLNHPNIVTIYDVARSKDSNYIVMEWVDGKPLDELIPAEGLPVVKAMEYACQIADGLTNAHQKYIIHRDIKPQNIMLSEQNSVKILDFGIAGYINNLNDENTDISDIVEPELITTGTPSYMSPEQAQGLNLDQRTDIFSFGIVLYQMLTGKRPFVGTKLTELKQAICSGDYIPIQQHLPDLPSSIINLVDKMLATKKDERWQSSAELAEVLHTLYDDLTYKKNWWQRRHWLSKVGVVLPFVLVLAWSSKEILFPASTQQLIQRQLQEATKIAILPFDNISGDPLLQLFSDGLAVNLGSDLSAIASHQGNTWIVPSTEISRMKDQSPKKVADKYGVNLILTGSIQHMGSTRLLVLNLLNAEDGQQLKTVEVSIDAEQLFQGHGKIRKQALALLNWSIPEELSVKFKADRPQLDGAYKEYVQGKGYLYRFDQKGNSDKALESFQKAINIDPNYKNAYVGLAEVYLRKYHKSKDSNWLDSMSLAINKLAKIDPFNVQISFLSAELAMKKGEYETAKDLYEVSIKQNKKHIKSQIGLAQSYSKMNNFTMAEQVYRSAALLAPNNWKVNVFFGIFYFQNGKYNKALIQFKELTKKSPNNNYGYRNMAASYYSLGDINNAILYTKKAIELKPSSIAYSNLGTMLFYEKKYTESVIAYEKALDLNKSNYLYWGNLADAYKIVGDSKSEMFYLSAANKAKATLNTNPNDTSVIADFAYYLANLNRKKEALNYIEKIGVSNVGSDNFIIATAYDRLNMTKHAIKHLKVALNKNYSLDEIINTPLLENSRKDKDFIKLISNSK